MSSWSGSAYPPRRSRSRSPGYRGGGPNYYAGRGPYPDPAAPDVYRADWEAYDRDRAWATYDRDRVAYDYNHRRRSRSPVDEVGRKRRRSTSPYDRDRYEPRPRYEDYDPHRGHAYSPPRTRGGRPGRPPPPDPHTFEYPASLKQFAEWFRYYYPHDAQDEDAADKAAEIEVGDGSKPRNGIKTRWEKYKKSFFANQLQTLFDHHRKSAWFIEKYDPSPDYAALRARVRKEGLSGRIDTFLNELDAGLFDGSLTEEATAIVEQTSSTEPVKEDSKDGSDTMLVDSTGAVNGENGVKEDHKEPKEDSKQDDEFNEAEDDAGGDKNGGDEDDKGRGGGPRRGGPDEVSVLIEGNQIMIRTIPPDIGRVKLEDAIDSMPGFKYLALGDPVQKRNFYRAGWVKFEDDADMAQALVDLTDKKIEGFKLHVTQMQRPFNNRMRKAPEVASRPDRLKKDLANVRSLIFIMENEATDLRKRKFSRLRKLRMTGEDQDPSSKQENGHDGDASAGENGTSLEENGAHPNAGTGVETAEEAAEKEAEENSEPDELEPREVGSVAVERRAEKLLDEWLEGEGVGSEQKAIDAKRTVLTLDLLLQYLRAAFHCCYYCVFVTDHREELQRKCIKHVRRPMSKLLLEEEREKEEKEAQAAKEDAVKPKEEEDIKMDGDEEAVRSSEVETKAKLSTENRDWKRNDERWLEWLDNKVALLLHRSEVDVRDYGGKRYEDELSKVVDPHIKQEEEGKFRCKQCQKLFKATSFVEKHIINKHSELLEPLDELPFFNNFALDPHHIQPFTHPAQAASQQPNFIAAHGAHQDRRFPYPAPVPGQWPGYPPDPRMDHAWGFDPYMYAGYPGYGPPPPRDHSRRLSDRLGGFVEDPLMMPPPSAGLPAKPPPMDMELGSGGGRRNGGGRERGPPPPPPPDAKEDPRAAAGRKVSYHDMDSVADGDVELSY